MKKGILLSIAFVVLFACQSFAVGLNGTWDFVSNNASFGQLIFDGSEGRIIIPAGSIDDPLERVERGPVEPYGSRRISFVREGAYPQLYQAWLSYDGCLMTGYLVNMNNHVNTSERFPFYAWHSQCQSP